MSGIGSRTPYEREVVAKTCLPEGDVVRSQVTLDIVADDARNHTRRWLHAGYIADATPKDGTRMRYVKSGGGPDHVLTHAVRPQLDIFQFVIALPSRPFTVFALDRPGFGWSDPLPERLKGEPTLPGAAQEFLQVLGLRRTIRAGGSTGVPMTNPEISSVRVTTEHVTIRSAKPFEAVRAVLEAALPRIDNAYVELLAAGKVDAARDLLRKQAPSRSSARGIMASCCRSPDCNAGRSSSTSATRSRPP